VKEAKNTIKEKQDKRNRGLPRDSTKVVSHIENSQKKKKEEKNKNKNKNKEIKMLAPMAAMLETGELKYFLWKTHIYDLRL
jgi:hypothetical protein